MKASTNARSLASLLVTVCLLLTPLTAMAAKKGEKNFRRGLEYESAQQWEKAAQEFTLAVAADPANMEYQLHYRRALFNASQSLMQQGRALAEQKDYLGAYNAFRQAYGYDPVNQLALSEMERMLRLQDEKTGGATTSPASGNGGASPARTTSSAFPEDLGGATPPPSSPTRGTEQNPEAIPATGRSEQLRVISYRNVDLKEVIRSLCEQLNLNVVFDRQSFAQSRTVDINLRDVTTGRALDYIFLQEGLFFQKLGPRTILVADQNRRAQYQQLVIRTFYLSNAKPADAQRIIQTAIPPSQGRPQIIVIPDESTNSLTVRDTAENVRLIGDILQGIDKDRAEVVMDVNIYEVSRSDLFQFGNQLGTADTTLTNLGGIQGGYSILQG
ncbi:MAG TPA: secretin N-terminal domain-containing protein, partial [Pyrinomonadaceae bacterium]